MLEYDNSAFYYFALTILIIYVIPGTWYALKEFFHAFFGSGDVGSKARTTLEKDKANALKRKSTGWTRLNTTAYITNLVFLVVAWLLVVYLVTLVMSNGEVSTFDPYQILGIEQGAAVSEIKKAYRKLSLKYHPDRNIGDQSKVAEEMFMKIAKAYESLTDEVSKENLEKYGNPDGKQALEVSIGLPKILLDNPKVVLVLYLIAMVVVIPSAVGWWYSESKQYGEKNILYDTYNAFYSLLQQSSTVKQLPEILAASAEFRKINESKPHDDEFTKKLFDKVKNDKLMLKPKYDNKRIIRGNLLLHSHLLRLTDELNQDAKEDLRKMLVKAPDLLEGMIEISYQRKWADTAINAIKLSQSVIQALWPTTLESINLIPFKQLPFLNDEDIKQIVKSSKPPARAFADYLRVPDLEKKGIANLSAADKEEFFKVCNLLPRLRVETKVFVEEEEKDFDEDGYKGKETSNSTSVVPTTPSTEIKGDQIFESDLVTLRVSITRENIPEGKNASPVFAPAFPSTTYENLWIVLLDKPKTDDGAEGKNKASSSEANIHAFEKVSEQGRNIKHELHFMAPPQTGKYELELRIFSDSYLGLDETRTIEFEVLPASMLPEYSPHPEDVELDNEPTLFEQMMAANVDDESSDEEDDDDEGEQLKSSPKKKNKNKHAHATKKKVQVVEEEDEEEEDD